MDYAELPPQNPNPNSQFPQFQIPNYAYQQPPTIDPNSALFHQPPGVDAPPYAPPQAIVQCSQQQVQYEQQQVQYEQQQVQYEQQLVSYDPQQSGYYYYNPQPDANVSWGGSVAQLGEATYAACVNTPNPAIRPQRKNTPKKAPKMTKVVQSAWCEVCNISCNTEEVLNKHKLGKKHIKNLEKLRAPFTHVPIPFPAIFAVPQPIAAVPLQSIPAAVPTPSPASSAPLPSDPIDKPVIGPEENPDKPKLSKSQKLRKRVAASRIEDLETKRRKVVEGGADADSVRACSVCNVICNSETVFKYHLRGQKHASMVRKQAMMAAGVVPAM